MKIHTVKFVRTDGSHEIIKQVDVRAVSVDRAISKGVAKAFGRTAFFVPNGIDFERGQVFRQIRGAAHSSSLTPVIRVDVEQKAKG